MSACAVPALCRPQVYGPTAWWWEVEELVRKLLLSAVVVLFDAGSPLQITLAVIVCSWAHVIHGVYKPWGSSSVLYGLQHMSLLVTSFVFLMGLLFKVRHRWLHTLSHPVAWCGSLSRGVAVHTCASRCVAFRRDALRCAAMRCDAMR